MPRRNRREDSTSEPPRRGGAMPIAAPAGWQALRHMGASSGRVYLCPRCMGEFAASLQHVVAWRSGEEDERRHWHTACFDRAAKEGLDGFV